MTLIERNAIGGSAVLTDVVPSKTLIATADMMTRFSEAGSLSIENTKGKAPQLRVDMDRVNRRVRDLAQQQSADIKRALAAGVKIIHGTVSSGRHTVQVTDEAGLVYPCRRTLCCCRWVRIRVKWRPVCLTASAF